MSATQEVGEIFGDGIGIAHAMLRSPTVIIASIGLWGMNVYVFRTFNIDYVKILQHDVRKLEHGDLERRKTARKSPETEHMIASGEQSERSEAFEQDQEVSIMDTSYNHNEDFFDEEITAGQLICFSFTLLLLLHITYSVWIEWLEGGTLGAVFSFYGAVTVAICLPLKSTRWLRHAAYLVFHRMWELINPRLHCFTASDKVPRPIPFVDVFFADAMCSMSKVFFDWGILLHMASYYPKPVAKTAWNILIPSAFAAVPYVIRARQCLVMWSVTNLKNDPGKYQHLWNALKYSTSIFPLLLSAYQKTVMEARAEDLEGVLIILLVINASYALWWDVVMDWGMMKTPQVAASVLCGGPTANGFAALPTSQPAKMFGPPSRSISGGGPTSCWYALLRSRLRYGVLTSVVILIIDMVLRFSWTLRFWHQLFPSNDAFVLTSEFLEVVRRALWNLLRIEWEHMKQSGTASQAVPPTVTSGSPPEEATPSSFSLRTAMATAKPKITTEKNAEA